MTPLDQLLKWNSDWSIINATIKCKRCGAIQREINKSERFPHLSNCRIRGADLNPWEKLQDVRDALEKR
jgi:endogenous inhibitor of DNA gyrase (YacG/DUF329 family)